LFISSGLLAAYYGPDWPEITALLARENGYMHKFIGSASLRLAL